MTCLEQLVENFMSFFSNFMENLFDCLKLSKFTNEFVKKIGSSINDVTTFCGGNKRFCNKMNVIILILPKKRNILWEGCQKSGAIYG